MNGTRRSSPLWVWTVAAMATLSPVSAVLAEETPRHPEISGQILPWASPGPAMLSPGPFTSIEEIQRIVQQQQGQLHEQRTRLDELEHNQRFISQGGERNDGNPLPVLAAEAETTVGSEAEGLPAFASPRNAQRYPHFTVGGQYRLMFNGANFSFHDAAITDSQPSKSFFNQRFRPWMTVQTSENVEGYVQMEIGHIVWGDNLDFPKTYVGPRFPPADDRVGIEMRYGYLTYTPETGGRWRAGIQPWQDAFEQTLASSDWDFSVGGLSWLTTMSALGDMQLQAGVFVLFEGDVQQADDSILWALDGDWKDDCGNSVGWSIYALSDHGGYSYPTAPPYDSSWDAWFGLRATLQTGLAPLHSFLLYNTGKRNELGGASDFRHNGWAAKLATGPQPFWFGQLRFQTLWSTGESNPNERSSREFRTIAQGTRDNFGAQGYWSYLAITSPHGPSDVNDLGVSLQNRGLGLITAQAAFDYTLTDRLSSTFAVGWLNSAVRNPISNSRAMGTELLNMLTFDFGGGLKADLGAAVLLTGDFYRPSPVAATPKTLWEAFTRVQLEF